MAVTLAREELMLDLGAKLSTICREFGLRVPEGESTD